jgi:hypothetical protein
MDHRQSSAEASTNQGGQEAPTDQQPNLEAVEAPVNTPVLRNERLLDSPSKTGTRRSPGGPFRFQL